MESKEPLYIQFSKSSQFRQAISVTHPPAYYVIQTDLSLPSLTLWTRPKKLSGKRTRFSRRLRIPIRYRECAVSYIYLFTNLPKQQVVRTMNYL